MIDSPERTSQLQELCTRLQLGMSNMSLLDQALTHASVIAENHQTNGEGVGYDYEALEFIGDAVLGLAVAHRLYERSPECAPGFYTRRRAELVNRRCLARVAKKLRIAEAIRLGKGEEQSGGRERISLLADCLEAIIGAVYLDGGWEAARVFVCGLFDPEIERQQATNRVWDFKSRLQNYCQAQHFPLPQFNVVSSEGPDHRKEFEVEVAVQGRSAGRGRGSSKKEAEQNAARVALEWIESPSVVEGFA